MRDITKEDKADLTAFPFNEAAEMRALGALGPHGEAGYSTLERRCAQRPINSFLCNRELFLFWQSPMHPWPFPL